MREQGIDVEDDNAVFKFAYKTIMGVFKEIRKAVPEDKRLYINSYTVMNEDMDFFRL